MKMIDDKWKMIVIIQTFKQTKSRQVDTNFNEAKVCSHKMIPFD